MMTLAETQALKAALLWHIDAGADMPLSAVPSGLLARPSEFEESVKSCLNPLPEEPPVVVPLGASESRAESLKLAQAAGTLDQLRDAIAGFDGISLKATATRMVFADGNSRAPVMIIGEAPGADEDRLGLPFVGVSGQLLDRILAAIGLSRASENPQDSVYISNILNWRPPGNRTPTPAEIEISLPFIERHIQLVRPRLLVFAGGVAAQALLGSTDSISRLRGRWHDYLPRTPELRAGAVPIPALATYHPSYLLRTPAQKRQVWGDMLDFLEKQKTLSIIQ